MATFVKLDEDLKCRVRRLAGARHRSEYWIMREAVRDYVEREEKRKAFRQDALQAWETYQENELHLTQAEADAWLAKLEGGDDMKFPKCHV